MATITKMACTSRAIVTNKMVIITILANSVIVSAIAMNYTVPLWRMSVEAVILTHWAIACSIKARIGAISITMTIPALIMTVVTRWWW